MEIYPPIVSSFPNFWAKVKIVCGPSRLIPARIERCLQAAALKDSLNWMWTPGLLLIWPFKPVVLKLAAGRRMLGFPLIVVDPLSWDILSSPGKQKAGVHGQTGLRLLSIQQQRLSP